MALQLIVRPHILKLSSPFRVAHGSRTEQPTLIVEIRDTTAGISGYGEAAMTSYYGLDLTWGAQNVKRILPALRAHTHTDHPEEIMTTVDRKVPDLHPFLRCAIDQAVHDLWARGKETRLGKLWEQPDRLTPTCYTIGMGELTEMVDKLTAFPWPVYKIKVGGADDLAILGALRERTTAPFYVDANTGWTARQTIDYSERLAALGVVFIEQPLPTEDAAGQAEVFRHSALPIIADESCQTEADVERCVGRFHGINIKAVKCGGLAPSRRMVAQARVAGLLTMVGCMTESSVGISALAQLLPELDYADMDGALLIANDPARGVTFDRETGYAVYPERNGTGVELR